MLYNVRDQATNWVYNITLAYAINEYKLALLILNKCSDSNELFLGCNREKQLGQ